MILATCKRDSMLSSCSSCGPVCPIGILFLNDLSIAPAGCISLLVTIHTAVKTIQSLSTVGCVSSGQIEDSQHEDPPPTQHLRLAHVSKELSCPSNGIGGGAQIDMYRDAAFLRNISRHPMPYP